MPVTIADRYRVVATTGTTADAIVYAAEDVTRGGPVTLSVLRGAAAADADFVAAVREQVHRLTRAGFAHPALVGVHGCGTTEDGDLFVAVEAVAGRSLRAVLEDGGPLDLPSALRVAIQIGEALETLHRGGVVHGELRPDAVLVVDNDDGSQTVKLTGVEFASAHQTEAGRRLRDEALVPYLAPEQVERNETTEAADVHALGLLVQELLTGQRPRAGARPGPARALPPSIARIVAKALGHGPARRYANVSLMVNDLWSADTEPPRPAAGEGVVRAAPAERRSASRRRARSDAGMVTALVVGLVLVGVTAWVVTSDRLAGTARVGGAEPTLAASPPAPPAAGASVAPAALHAEPPSAPPAPEVIVPPVSPPAAPAAPPVRPVARAAAPTRVRETPPADGNDGSAIIDWLLNERRPGG